MLSRSLERQTTKDKGPNLRAKLGKIRFTHGHLRDEGINRYTTNTSCHVPVSRKVETSKRGGPDREHHEIRSTVEI